MTATVRPARAATTEGIPAWTVVTVVLWGALLGALSEFVARATMAAFPSSLASNFHLYPMAIAIGPLVNLPVFAVAVALAWLIGRMFTPRRVFEAIAFAVVALAVFEVALITQRVHPAALAVFATGVATVAVRLARRSPRSSVRFVNVSTLVMSLVAISGGAAVVWRASVAERRALAALADPPLNAPNVVVLILDTVRAIELGMYGNTRNVSPHLDSLARNAVRFEQAYSTAPWTLPSHATMLSGRYPQELSTGWSQPFNGEYPLVSELLRAAGYVTGAFVGNTTYLNRRWGLDRGFVRYEDYQVDATVLWTTSNLAQLLVRLANTSTTHRILVNGTSAKLIRERFGAWQQRIGDRPFFAFLNFFDAHAPYGAPAPFDTLFLGRRPRAYDIDNWSQRGAEEHNELRAGYDQAIAWLDSQVGALVADLRDRGLLDRTYIIITADHGEDFGEHGYSGHGASLHSTQTRVPLIVIPPSYRGEVIVPDLVTLRDLAATIGEVAGLERGAMPGSSLTSYWTTTGDSSVRAPGHSPILSEVKYGRRDLKPWYPSAHGRMQSIREGGLAYTLQEGGVEFLYDRTRDPLEQRDLSKVAAWADSLRRLRTALQEALASDGNAPGVRR